MKNHFFVLFIAFMSFTHINAQSSWDYTEFESVINSSGILYTLEYGIYSSGYDGRVKWRITNHTNKPVYDVTIARKYYTLSDGKRVTRAAELITLTLNPGESKSTISDAVNSDENYGTWSNKNDNPPIEINLENPMVRFAIEKNGKKYSWDSASESVGQNENNQTGAGTESETGTGSNSSYSLEAERTRAILQSSQARDEFNRNRQNEINERKRQQEELERQRDLERIEEAERAEAERLNQQRLANESALQTEAQRQEEEARIQAEKLEQQKLEYELEQQAKWMMIQSNIEAQRIEQEKMDAAFEKMGEEIGYELADIFTGELDHQNVLNITESILYSGLITDLNTFGNVAIVGGLAAAGVGVAQQQKMMKIESSSERVADLYENYQRRLQEFNVAINENNDNELLRIHNNLIWIEDELHEESDFLISKAGRTDLKQLKNTLDESREKRTLGVDLVRDRLFRKFHSMHFEDRQRFIDNGGFGNEEIDLLKNPTVRNGSFINYYPDSWRVATIGYKQMGEFHGLALSYHEDGSPRLKYLMSHGTKEYGIVYYTQDELEQFDSLNSVSFPIKKLIEDNLTFRLFANGKLWTVVQTDIYGNMDGLGNAYYENGVLKESYLFKAVPTIDSWITEVVEVLAMFDTIGQPLDMGDLSNGNGYAFEYDLSGGVNKIEFYKDGQIQKEYTDPIKISRELRKYRKKYPNGNYVKIKSPRYSIEIPEDMTAKREEIELLFKKAEETTQVLKGINIDTSPKY